MRGTRTVASNLYSETALFLKESDSVSNLRDLIAFRSITGHGGSVMGQGRSAVGQGQDRSVL